MVSARGLEDGRKVLEGRKRKNIIKTTIKWEKNKKKKGNKGKKWGGISRKGRKDFEDKIMAEREKEKGRVHRKRHRIALNRNLQRN